MSISSTFLTLLAPLLSTTHVVGGAGESFSWETFLVLPPPHPLLVNFSAALIPVSFVSDLLGKLLRRESLTAAGWWTLLYAALITPFTALAGWVWLSQMGEMEHGEMVIHQWLGFSLTTIFLCLAVWRWRVAKRRATPGFTYLSVLALTLLALIFQGHLGGMMSFGREPQAARSDDGHVGHSHDGEAVWKSELEVKE